MKRYILFLFFSFVISANTFSIDNSNFNSLNYNDWKLEQKKIFPFEYEVRNKKSENNSNRNTLNLTFEIGVCYFGNIEIKEGHMGYSFNNNLRRFYGGIKYFGFSLILKKNFLFQNNILNFSFTGFENIKKKLKEPDKDLVWISKIKNHFRLDIQMIYTYRKKYISPFIGAGLTLWYFENIIYTDPPFSSIAGVANWGPTFPEVPIDFPFIKVIFTIGLEFSEIPNISLGLKYSYIHLHETSFISIVMKF